MRCFLAALLVMAHLSAAMLEVTVSGGALTDVTDAVRTCLDDCECTTIYIPEGTYEADASYLTEVPYYGGVDAEDNIDCNIVIDSPARAMQLVGIGSVLLKGTENTVCVIQICPVGPQIDVTFTNINFAPSTTEPASGYTGIFAQGTVTVEECSFKDLTIGVLALDVLVITRSVFTSNEHAVQIGASFEAGNAFDIDRCEFTSNAVAINIVSLVKLSVLISNSLFQWNTAALFSDEAVNILSSCKTEADLYPAPGEDARALCSAALPAGFFEADGVFALCTTPSCSSCPGDVCDGCFSPLLLHRTSCVEACPAGSSLSPDGDSCPECPTGCRLCSETSAVADLANGCDACGPPYYDNNGVTFGGLCVNSTDPCAAGFYREEVTMTSNSDCVPCSVGCAECTAPSVVIGDCIQCDNANQYYDNNGVATGGVCAHASEGCALGSYATSAITSDSSCVACDDNPGCLGLVTCSGGGGADEGCPAGCAAGYHIHDGRCTQCTTGCLQCVGPGVTLDAGCLVCSSGYFDSNGNVAGGTCLANGTGCDGGYIWNSSASECTPCSVHAVGCAVHDPSACLTQAGFESMLVCTVPTTGFSVPDGIPLLLACPPHAHGAPLCVCDDGYYGQPLASAAEWSDACEPCDPRCAVCSNSTPVCATCSSVAVRAGSTCTWLSDGIAFVTIPGAPVVGDELVPRPTVMVLNKLGGTNTDATLTILLSLHSGAAQVPLNGATEVVATNGLARFIGLSSTSAALGAHLVATDVPSRNFTARSGNFTIRAPLCFPGTYTADGSCLPCEAGTVSPNYGQARCSVCDTGKYSVEGISCEACRSGAICSDGIERARTGYFRVGAGVYVACMNADAFACPGGDAVGNNVCGTGHEGAFCASCSREPDVYAMNASRCSRCQPFAINVLLVLLAVVVVLLFIAFSVYTASSAKPADACLKILLNHLQVLGLIQSLSVHVASYFQQVMGWTAAASGPSPSMFPFRCLADINFYTVLYLTIGIQAAALFLMIVLSAVYSFIRKKALSLCLAALLPVWTITFYPSVSTTVVKALQCRGDVGRVAADLTLECPSADFTGALITALLMTLVWVVGLPLAYFLVVRRTTVASPMWHALHFLHNGFRPEVSYFETFVMLRKTSFVCIVALIDSTTVQLAAAMAVIAVSLGVHIKLEPYVLSKMNTLEVYGLAISLLSVASSIMFLGFDNDSAIVLMFSLAALVCNLIFVAILVAVVVKSKLGEKGKILPNILDINDEDSVKVHDDSIELHDAMAGRDVVLEQGDDAASSCSDTVVALSPAVVDDREDGGES